MVSGISNYKSVQSGINQAQQRASTENSAAPHSVSHDALSGIQTENVQVVEPVHNIKLQKEDITAGDVLILLDQQSNTTTNHQLIKVGQKLVVLSLLRNNKGDPALVHAVMWSKRSNNPGRTSINSSGESEIVEMRGGMQLSSNSGPIRQGLYKVYSPKNKDLGDWAAQVGQAWSADQSVPYSKTKSVLSVLRNSNFGERASKASQSYSKEAFENRPQISGAFCSHFIIAAYQAAASRMGIPYSEALKVDAEATSVRTLEHFLKADKDNFEFKGMLNISAEEVLY